MAGEGVKPGAAKEAGLVELAARLAKRRGSVRLQGLRGASQALAAAQLIEAHTGAALVVAAGAKQADRFALDLQAALGEPQSGGGRVRVFPHPDTAPYDRFSPQPFVVAQRMDVLHRLAAPRAADCAAPVLVAPWTALAWRVPTRAAVRAASLQVARGDELDRDEFALALAAAGYARQPLAEERGEFALRGGIVDVFPPQRAFPVRIELLGSEVESLREFDPASQRSQAELQAAALPPPRELLLQRDLVVAQSGALRARAEQQGVPPAAMDAMLDSLLRGALPPGAEAIAPLLQPGGCESFFDFLPEDALLILAEPAEGKERMQRFADEAMEAHDSARASAQRLVCEPGELLLTPDAIDAAIAARRAVHLERLEVQTGDSAAGESIALRAAGNDALCRELQSARGAEQPLAPLLRALRGWCEAGQRVALLADALSGAERLRALLGEHGFEVQIARESAPARSWSAPGEVQIRVADLSAGFALPEAGLAVLTEQEIFGPRQRRRPTAGFGAGLDAAQSALAKLAPGDRLVHAEHGIGVYRGFVLLKLGRSADEFLRIEYDGGDRLFVPVHRLNLVQPYVGADGVAPPLDRLGGATWEKTRRAVRRSLRDMAKGLLEVHAARELAPGTAFAPRDRALADFEARFPFEETPDQSAAIADVLTDLATPRPMDRLICGDVGYGKTEVACRAAHQVLMAGAQVALLVPTTILCQQHLNTFRKRFAGLPARIESLSRFSSPAQSRAVLEGMENGGVDLVIGTHRLLQKNVRFRNLGLLVVDEEHRFGVAHKERIKRFRQSVDVLTLTATPIPRTLQMAFTSLRDLSVIATPPPDRLAVRTQLCRFEESLVREAILREVRRGGQVFFVHNRVRSIGAIAELLQRIVPEVRVQVAHGQMPERELEDRMRAFLNGDYDLLLCTTIIESGLDMPRVNTILVDRADRLGLAQLYQLRGRVGRSGQRAYAYLLIPGEAALTRQALSRLEAIQDLAGLGSGFCLASMDLEIRGAGNLLGAEQSGHLSSVGYSAYMELLEEAVLELRSGGAPARALDPEIRLPLPARLPEEYVPDVSQRLVLYKRLAGAPDLEEAERLRDELLDRYGPLPAEAHSLLGVIRLKIAARDLGVASIGLEGGELVLSPGADHKLDPARIVALHGKGVLRAAPDQRLRAAAGGAENLIERAAQLLGELRGPAAQH